VGAYDSGVAGSNVNALRSHSATCCGSWAVRPNSRSARRPCA